jgi:hypothetical protein
MTTEAPEDVRTGEYVHGTQYLTMRLRMLLTGTAAPDEATWADALKRLLAHVAANPVPGTPADRAADFAEAWGVAIVDPPAPKDERGEREEDAGHEIRMLDLDDDLIGLVEGSDTPIAGRMAGRVMDTATPVPGSFVLLAARSVGDYDCAIDALVRFEDEGGPDRIALTLFGTRLGSDYDWKRADLSRRTPATEEDARERKRIAGILHVIGGGLVREKADADASAAIEADLGAEDAMSLMQTVRPEDIVLTGDDSNVVFTMPVELHIHDRNGPRRVEVVHQGRMTRDMTTGGIELCSVGLGI